MYTFWYYVINLRGKCYQINAHTHAVRIKLAAQIDTKLQENETQPFPARLVNQTITGMHKNVLNFQAISLGPSTL